MSIEIALAIAGACIALFGALTKVIWDMLMIRINDGDNELQRAIDEKASREYTQNVAESTMRIREDFAKLEARHDTLRQDISRDIKDLAGSLRAEIRDGLRDGLREVANMINVRGGQ